MGGRMRIAWYSNGPMVGTGYGQQTAMMVDRLAADGHDVAVLGNFGHVANIINWPTPSGKLVPVWPHGYREYSVDVADDQARVHFGGNPGYVISLFDVWVLHHPDGTPLWRDQKVVSWTPVDHYPVPPEVLKWARSHRTIAMSRFGQEALREQKVASTYIPHAISRAFTPLPQARGEMNLPEDAFLVLVVAANKGVAPCRKSFPELLAAFAAFARDHDDAYLYLHTDATASGGYPIQWAIDQYAIPHERIRTTEPLTYRTGLMDDAAMAKLYSTANVLLAPSMGEGFGIPVAESMACGTPAIVTDFSAQPEIVGNTGWKVPWQPWLDPAQKAMLATPLIPAIRDALEEAYEERGTEKAAARSLAAQARVRAEYDADTVYAEKWRPLLAELEEELKPRQRAGMSKAARRRMQKRAA